MNTFQNHYGMAIRQNRNNLYAMKKAVAAVLHHSTTNEDLEKRHQYCPRTTDSWCKFQRDKITEGKTYKENVSIDKTVLDLTAPVFFYKDLGSDESLNNLTRTRCTKTVCIGNSIFKASVASAVIMIVLWD